MKKLLLSISLCVASTCAYANNYECMAKNIYFETLGAPEVSKRAVAQTTMNRVNHKNFPNSVCSVVYQKNQYSWTTGRGIIKDKNEYNISMRIAREAVNGNVVHHEVYKTNALFFHAKRINPRWNYKKVYTDNVHVFYTYKKNGKNGKRRAYI